MTTHENLKPKSIRISILAALANNGITTVDDLQTQLDQSRKTIVDNALHAINDLLIERVRDEVTGLAAYQITLTGRKFLANHNQVKPDTSNKAASCENKIAQSPVSVQKQPNPPPTDKRPSPPPLPRNVKGSASKQPSLPQEKKAFAAPIEIDLIPEKTFTIKVNNIEFIGMKLVSSWEGLHKLEDSTGRWLIVMETETPIEKAFSEIFGKNLNKEQQPKSVIPVIGSTEFRDAIIANSVKHLN